MSSVRLAFSSSDDSGKRRERDGGPDSSPGRFSHSPATRGFAQSLSSMRAGVRGEIVEVRAHAGGRPGGTDRLLALGVTPGARVTVLQTFPGVVFLCDQTELAVERGVADAVLVRVQETRS